MKRLMIAALASAQLAAAAPASAAELSSNQAQEIGAFAGFRVRVPLDGTAQQRQVRAGVTLAPAVHSRSADGESRLRIGDGLELGVVGDQPVGLSIAGTPMFRLAQDPQGPEGNRAGISTLGWVAISAAVIVGTVFVLGQLCVDGEICGSE